ncbi:MAG: stalk domain-containing protein [Clostridia bacterium]|nr:stalk domain-containing protein [Clostridia bacterium]
MMFGKKRWLLLYLTAVFVFLFSYSVYANAAVQIYIDGEKLECEAEPVIEDGAVLVPMRSIFEAVNAQVSWDEAFLTANAIKGERTISITANKEAMQSGSKEVALNHVAVIRDGTMFVPIRAVAEFGFNISWDNKNRRVNITSAPPLKVYFLDCGQGDCSFLEFPNGQCMLIDSGLSSFGESLVDFIREKGYNKIDYVVATHPHRDHIGSMEKILNTFEVGAFYMPNVEHTTKTFEKMLLALEKNGCKCGYISKGSVIEADKVVFAVLAPDGNEYTSLNDYSAVLRMNYLDMSILFSADAQAASEYAMLSSGVLLEADVLKVGHHGSDSSTSLPYLSAVSPSDGVISVGRDNPYGFPKQSVLENLKLHGVQIHRTDIEGTIELISDGYVYCFEK